LDSVQQAAQLLYKAVKKAAVSLDNLEVGDRIVVTGTSQDKVGVVKGVVNGAIVLKTSLGVETLQVSDKNFIHIIQKKADMLNLRKHIDYERDLKDMAKEDHQQDGRPEYGPVEESDKSELPASKISLVMKRQKGAMNGLDLDSYIIEDYYYDPKLAVQDILRMLRGEFDLDTLRSSIIEQKRSDEERSAATFDEGIE